MISPLEIVLVAIMIGKNNFTGEVELQYQSVNRYTSMSICNKDRLKLLKKDKDITYLCLKVDYE
jgi:hypothetical protein